MNNLHLFTGPETFQLYEQVNAWKHAFLQKHGDLNLIMLDSARDSVGEIVTQMEALPFLGDKRLLFISGLPEAPPKRAPKKTENDEGDEDEEEEEEIANVERLTEALEGVPETSVVVFIQPNPDKRKSLYKKIVQKATVKTFGALPPNKLNQWIKEGAERHGTSIDPATTEHLIALAGTDLWRLDRELMKLSAYCDGTSITPQAIDELVTPTHEASVFQLTDALGENDRRTAMKAMEDLVASGEPLQKPFFMIARQFRILLSVGSYMEKYPNTDSKSIALEFKLHPFVAQKTLKQVRLFKLKKLRNAHERILEIDIAMKTGGIRTTKDDPTELALALERFILDFCS
jgi:DNA polymerase-3 subunit delta